LIYLLIYGYKAWVFNLDSESFANVFEVVDESVGSFIVSFSFGGVDEDPIFKCHGLEYRVSDLEDSSLDRVKLFAEFNFGCVELKTIGKVASG
jgi:hypothetical protein